MHNDHFVVASCNRKPQPALASELSTWQWLQTQSALGELTDVDYEGMSQMSLYRASDALMRHHRSAIEDHLFGTVQTLFCLAETVTLHDLTNTYSKELMAGHPFKGELGWHRITAC